MFSLIAPHRRQTPQQRRRLTRGVLAGVLLTAAAWSMAWWAQPAASADPPTPGMADNSGDSNSALKLDRPNVARGDEITPAQKRAVERGLAWLARRQPPGGGAAGYSNHAGITALAGLAFMESGNLPGRGKYGKEVQRILEFVLNNCQESGLITSDYSQGPMYGHGFATVFLGEIYGMTGDETVKEHLEKAVRLIEKTQNAEGGWRYQPAPIDADISVTICEVMGLRAARDAGIKVDKDVIDKAIKYVERCQNPDGGFSYMANAGGMMGGSAYPRSAAGVAALYYAGVFQGPQIEKGLKYLGQFIPGKVSNENLGHYYYGYYYGTQAMFLAGGHYWAVFYPAIRDELIHRQGADGSWQGDFNDDYATSMALIILQMPNRYLPVFAGKGPGS
jgi:prenyltransferase beta subunit